MFSRVNWFDTSHLTKSNFKCDVSFILTHSNQWQVFGNSMRSSVISTCCRKKEWAWSISDHQHTQSTQLTSAIFFLAYHLIRLEGLWNQRELIKKVPWRKDSFILFSLYYDDSLNKNDTGQIVIISALDRRFDDGGSDKTLTSDKSSSSNVSESSALDREFNDGGSD